MIEPSRKQFFEETQDKLLDPSSNLTYEDAKSLISSLEFSKDSTEFKTLLHKAVTKWNVLQIKVIQAIIEHKDVDINSLNKNGETVLNLAYRHKKYEILDVLLENQNLQDIKFMGLTTLHRAAIQDENIRIIRKLVKHPGIDINSQNENGETTLYWACQNNKEYIVDALLENKDLQDIKCNGLTALQIAVHHEHIGIIRKLVEHPGVDIYSQDEKGNTALHTALGIKQKETAQIILEHMLRHTNMVSCNTVLHPAVKQGDDDIVKKIIELLKLQTKDNSSFINRLNSQGFTALHLACTKNNVNIVQILLDAGADITAVNKEKYSVLHYAAAFSNVKIIKMLLDHKVDGKSVSLSLEDPNKRTALHTAVSNGESIDPNLKSPEEPYKRSISVVKTLLDYSAIQGNKEYINLQDDLGHTALHYAATFHYIPLLTLLLEYGANIDIEDKDGDTPLFNAVEKGDVEAVELIASYRINVQKLDPNHHVNTYTGDTALHWAVKKEKIEVVKVLLKLGADVKIQAHDHSTPLSIAEQNGNSEIESLLLKSLVEKTTGFKHSLDELELSNLLDNDYDSTDVQNITQEYNTLGLSDENPVDDI